MVPNYIHVGAGKAGSTSLHFMLKDHAEVCLVNHKEGNFFNNDDFYMQGLPEYEKQLFSHYAGEKIVGDITPAYMNDCALERIRKDLGQNVKISICFRAPIQRAFSHYFHDIRLFNEDNSFHDIFMVEYVTPSLAGVNLKKLYSLFPKENIMPLIFERDIVMDNSSGAYNKICDFLEIKRAKIPIVKNGVGFLPCITKAASHGYAEDYRGRQFFQKGDIIIETLKETEYYFVEIRHTPSEEVSQFYLGRYNNITFSLSKAEIKTYYDTLFAEDVDLLRDLLQDDLPEWDLNTNRLSAPTKLESRIIYLG